MAPEAHIPIVYVIMGRNRIPVSNVSKLNIVTISFNTATIGEAKKEKQKNPSNLSISGADINKKKCLNIHGHILAAVIAADNNQNEM